jgi:ADP-ribosylglycohydrolase
LLIEIALGDAYGSCFEFSSAEKVAALNHANGYPASDNGVPAGCYTDDTQMSLAVLEVVLAGEAGSRAAYAEAFVRCYRRDARPGYAKGFRALLDECQSGAELLARIRNDSTRNGAAMRAVPLGLLDGDTQHVLAAAHAQASVTHNTPEGLGSAAFVALVSHFLLRHALPLPDAVARAEQLAGLSIKRDWAGWVECDGLQTVHAVATVLLRNRSMTALLRDAVAFGGDVDSVAAIALGLASLTPAIRNDLPPLLIEGLEDGHYGRSYLAGLDEQIRAAEER